MSNMKDVVIDLHNRYDNMNVHELVERLRTLSDGYAHRENTMYEDVSAIESAIRYKVIKEAQVGTIHLKLEVVLLITHCEGSDGISPLKWGVIKDGPYFIIPVKETKE